MATNEELLDELVRLRVTEMRRSHESQSETIVELSQAGFGNARIAELLGTSSATVKVAIHRHKLRGERSGQPVRRGAK